MARSIVLAPRTVQVSFSDCTSERCYQRLSAGDQWVSDKEKCFTIIQQVLVR